MRALFLSFVLLSFLLSQDKKEINFQLQNQQNLEWWSKYNNNGIDFKKSLSLPILSKKNLIQQALQLRLIFLKAKYY